MATTRGARPMSVVRSVRYIEDVRNFLREVDEAGAPAGTEIHMGQFIMWCEWNDTRTPPGVPPRPMFS